MKLLAVWKAEHKLTLPKLPLVVFFLCIIILAFVAALPPSLIKGLSVDKVSLGIVNHSDELLAKMMSDIAVEYNLIKSVSIRKSKTEAIAALERGEIDVLFIVDGSVQDALYYAKPIHLTLKWTDPFVGTVLNRVVSSTVETINIIEDMLSVVYQDSLQQMDYYEAGSAMENYLRLLVTEALTRSLNLDIKRTAKPYSIQLISLVQFIVCSVTAAFISVLSAKQIADGFIRRLYVRRFGVWRLIFVKLMYCWLLSMALSGLALIVLRTCKIECEIFEYLASTAILSPITASICFLVTAVNNRRGGATTKTALACLAVILLLLFMGGGFYPTYLMSVSFREFNPAWLAHLLAEWSLGGEFPPIRSAITFLIPAVLCISFTALRWRRAV